ncbi:MAG TPA: hypothetical protein VME19_17780 [Streptosporangiaceae bacterium]|nr:hypothetical protein [Streptosporangiaceae bacterium]
MSTAERQRRARLNAERSRRFRARQRGEDVPKRQPGPAPRNPAAFWVADRTPVTRPQLAELVARARARS